MAPLGTRRRGGKKERRWGHEWKLIDSRRTDFVDRRLTKPYARFPAGAFRGRIPAIYAAIGVFMRLRLKAKHTESHSQRTLARNRNATSSSSYFGILREETPPDA